MLAKMREGVETLFRSARIEDDLDQSKEAIVLDDELHEKRFRSSSGARSRILTFAGICAS
jgi:hypothetical protein